MEREGGTRSNIYHTVTSSVCTSFFFKFYFKSHSLNFLEKKTENVRSPSTVLFPSCTSFCLFRLSGNRLPFDCHLVCIVNCPFICALTRKYLPPHLSPSDHLSVLTFFYFLLSVVIFVASSFLHLSSWPCRPFSAYLCTYPVSRSVSYLSIPVLRKTICQPFCVDLHLVSIFCPPVASTMKGTSTYILNISFKQLREQMQRVYTFCCPSQG
jgi:hypothetical protein